MRVKYGRKHENEIEIPAMNYVSLVGVIGTRTQVKYTYSRKKVSVFKLCIPRAKVSETNKYYKDAPADFIEVVANGFLAETVSDYPIGAIILVQGKLCVHKYFKPDTRSNGIECYVQAFGIDPLKANTTKKMDEFLHDEEIRGRLYITDNEIRIMTVNDRGEAEVTPTDIDLTDVPM